MKKRGFTLIELLIVISIIGVLMAAGVASYSNMQKKSRDSRRRSDLNSIRTAFEQYYADSTNAKYPPAGCAIDTSYLPDGIPTGPKGETYSQACTTSSYCFCAPLESETNAITNCAGAVAASPYVGYVCVKQLQ